MKNILSIILFLSVVTGYYSCIKDRNTINTDFNSLKPFLELRTPDFPGAGTPNFAGIDHFENADIDALTLYTDTIIFYVNLASINTFNSPISVKVGLDQSLIKSFNDTSQIEYEQLPDFAYKILDENLVIPAGERVAKVIVVFKTKNFYQLDPTVNYMLPVTILRNDGIEVSENEGTVWFHKGGNCIAGTYDAVGTSTNPIYFSPKVMTGISSKVAEIDYGNQGPALWKYMITFDCAGEEIISVAPNDEMYKNIRVNSFTLVEPPTYNASKKQFHFVTQYILGVNGKLYTVDETLTKQ